MSNGNIYASEPNAVCKQYIYIFVWSMEFGDVFAPTSTRVGAWRTIIVNVTEWSKWVPRTILRCFSLVAESFLESWILTEDFLTSWCDFLINMSPAGGQRHSAAQLAPLADEPEPRSPRTPTGSRPVKTPESLLSLAQNNHNYEYLDVTSVSNGSR